ncbi:MAG: hypothetical protein WC350_04345 [Candidatus Micrarchaeia archaeon]|jgi:hypothetical protein
MAEQKDHLLWGKGFKERGDAYQAIATARHRVKIGVKDEFPRTIAEGKRLILGQFGLAQRYPQLEEPWIEAALFAFSTMPPENDDEWELKETAESRAADLRTEEALALGRLEDIGKDTREVVSLIGKAINNLMSAREKGAAELALEEEIAELERRLEGLHVSKPKEASGAEGDGWDDVEDELDREIASDTAEAMEIRIAEKRAKLGEISSKAEAEWAGKMAQDESLLEGYKELLDEQMAEAAKFPESRSAAVRRELVKVLIAARDVHSLINFCYAEMDPEAREAAFRNAAEAARAEPDSKISVGIHLGRDECSMLLRMVEDGEPKIASLAWELAEWMLDNGKLDGEQMDYVEMQAEGAKGNVVAARVLSKRRAGEWIDTVGRYEKGEARVPALANILEGMRSGFRLDNDQEELLLEFTEDTMPEISRQAWLVAMELCKNSELSPEQMAELARRANRITDAEKGAGTMAALFDAIPRGKLGADAEWSLCMAMVRHPDAKRMDQGLARAMEMLMEGKFTPENVEGFVELVESMVPERIDAGKRARIHAGVMQFVKPDGLTAKAAEILHVARVSQLFLEIVQPGRASRLPKPRKSDPPQDGKVCAPREAEKLKC